MNTETLSLDKPASLNKPQFLAADPKVSAWVTASAGTGKTKVLIDRMLNLLLHGFAPERILCLTFTKAAASEMANRLTQRLARWATLATPELIQELEILQGEAPSASQLARARQLFTLALDVPGGMKILTIHGFCQSILGRFPLEAGISPHFRILEEAQAEEFLKKAQYAVFTKPVPLVETSLALLNPYMRDNWFSKILKELCNQRTRVMALLERYGSIWDYAQELLRFLEVDICIEKIEDILDPDLPARLKKQFASGEEDFDSYITTYLTKKMEIRKKIPLDQMPQAEHVFRFVKSLTTLEVATRTLAALAVFQDVLKEYQGRKMRHGVLDYDDLIHHTQKLLQQPGVASWVLYKLDGGIDHLLVDEAQDTNTTQWEIIQRLTAEFFTPDKPYRTVFAVGDAKQSIYSFQGANPQDFLRLKDHFASLSQRVGQGWRHVQLDVSYRSTAAVLAIVDQVFAKNPNRQGVSFEEEDIVHHVFRKEPLTCLPGLVEVWPLVTPETEEEMDTGEWRLPLKRIERRSPQARLADFIADQALGWLSSKNLLPSTLQPVQPRDILILARKRSVLGQEIIRALKSRNIPVAGADRLDLTDHIAVMDLLALGQFVLLPEDDLTLACVLRSPLVGLSEEDLFTLAYEREGTLWDSLSQKACQSSALEAAHAWLKSCLREADLCPVYEFYSWVLIQGDGWRKFLSRLGQEAEDTLEEFLTQALSYDQDHASSLQGFVQFMNSQSQEIKRDASNTAHNQVRLMTVHGSKGLQAPIVILPDAADAGKEKGNLLLWEDNLLLLRPTQIQDTEKTRSLKEKGAAKEAEEKRRLLYVALTRAEDRLFVGGWTKGKEVAQGCWYKTIQEALETKAGAPRYLLREEGIVKEGSREEIFEGEIFLPAWAQTLPTGVIMKEKGEARLPKAPVTGAMERGVLIHRFFEYLPKFGEGHRYTAARQMVEKENLLLADWEEDIQATLRILDHPEFKDLFGPGSLPEVPLCGILEGKPFQGRIDRLLVTPDTLTIIDYKTSRLPPAHGEDIPVAYIRQMEGYATALKSIYPQHHIRKFLLWTTGPKMQEV